MSSRIITEVATLDASDLLRADPSLFTQLTGDLKPSAGALRQALGSRVDEPEKWQLFIDWESLEHHKEVEAQADVADLTEKMSKLLTAPPKMSHVSFAPFDAYARSFAAPVTEIVFATLKNTTDAQVFKKINDASLVAAEKAEGRLSHAWGYTIENEKVAVIVIGWNSIEAHKKFAQAGEFQKYTDPWLELVSSARSVYVKFQQDK